MPDQLMALDMCRLLESYFDDIQRTLAHPDAYNSIEDQANTAAFYTRQLARVGRSFQRLCYHYDNEVAA